MAALPPGADTSFDIDLDDNGKLLIRVGDTITGVEDRVKRLEQALTGKWSMLTSIGLLSSPTRSRKSKLGVRRRR